MFWKKHSTRVQSSQDPLKNNFILFFYFFQSLIVVFRNIYILNVSNIYLTKEGVNYGKQFGDLFKVEPANEYPADYMKCIDVAKKEQQDDARPEIKETLSDINDYEVIYIGFPNWWGTLPMPMWTQLEQLDFTGKVVKPFVTHEGSGFGSSQRDLAKLCDGAEIKKGLSIPGANVYDAKDSVAHWVDE